MEEIMICPVTKENWYACTQLSVTKEQEALFPASVVYWLAESKFEPSFIPMSLYAGQSLIGFSIIGIEPETQLMWIVAFMIDRHVQGKGFIPALLPIIGLEIVHSIPMKENNAILRHKSDMYFVSYLFISITPSLKYVIKLLVVF